MQNFNEIRLKTQIEEKMEEKTMTFQRENFQNLHKISQFYTTKFTQSDLKSQEKMHTFKMNLMKFD